MRKKATYGGESRDGSWWPHRRTYLNLIAGLGAALSGCARSGPLGSTQTDSTPEVLEGTQVRKLVPPEEHSAKRFGRSIAITGAGGMAIVGSPYDDQPNGFRSGSAYVYERTANSWSQQTKITPPDGGRNDWFGSVVSVSDDGTTALFGAPFDEGGSEETDSTDPGSAYVFEYTNGSWQQASKLTGDNSEATDRFGSNVALSANGNTGVVSAPRELTPGRRGAVYVYHPQGESWTQQAKFTDEDESVNMFGKSVALSGDGTVTAVSAENVNTAGMTPKTGTRKPFRAGVVFVFERSDGAWERQVKLTAPDGDKEDFLGQSVAVSNTGRTIIAGAPQDEDPNGDYAGSAYVFERSNNTWDHQAKLTPSDGDTEDYFGGAVTVSGEGEVVVVGAGGNEDPNGTGAGSAYMFQRSNGSWEEQAKLTADDGDSEDAFGAAVEVASDGSAALVSAYMDEDSNGEGAAYIFD